MASTAKLSAPNLQRGLCVLEFLATSQSTATVAELAEQLGYPMASLYRIATVLTEMGYISRDAESKRYRLTNKLLRFGQPQSHQLGLVEAAIPALRGLWKATGETSQICCLVDTESVVLEQFISVHPFKYSTDIGARVPCYSCSTGKAMLAFLPEAQQDDLVKRLKFQRFTSTTITTQKRLREELHTIQQQGYALDNSEGLEGIRCIAAPVCDANGHAVGALTIAAPATRLPTNRYAEISAFVIQAAQAAGQAYR